MPTTMRALATFPAGAEPGIQRIKLVAPSPVARSVARVGIIERLTQARNAKLVLFRAPAGFGKTTAMRQYLDALSEMNIATAWIRIDALDDDFRRFIIHLIAALRSILNITGNSRRDHEGTHPKPDVDRMTYELLDKLSNYDSNFVLFIDNLELVSNRFVDDFLRLLLNHLPQGGQIVIGTRNPPDLQLGRLRVLNELVEVDQEVLQFSRQETDEILRAQHRLTLAEKEISKLYSDTGGWPAAIWLAATALQDRERPDSFIATFSGSNTAIAEYLTEEVLSRQSEDIRQFMVKTSIIGDMNRNVCNIIVGIANSDTILSQLEKAGICTGTLDANGITYRYNGLLSKFLKSQLNILYPSSVSSLQIAAARWYEAAGRPIPAIEHALASDDLSYALALLQSHADNLLFQGRFRLLVRWFSIIPRDVLRSTPELQLANIWALTFTGRAAETLKLLDKLDDDQTMAGANELADEMNALRPYILSVLDRHEEGYRLAEEFSSKCKAPSTFAHYILITMLATWKVAANKYSKALDLLKHASISQTHGDQTRGQMTFPGVYAICIEGRIALVQGRVRTAIAHFQVAMNGAAANFGTRSVAKTITAVYLAEALYEIDELDQSEKILALYLPVTKEYALPDPVISSHVIQARIVYERGDVDHAFRLLSELEYFGRHSNLPRVLAAAQLERARIALARGDVAEAQSHFERANNPEAWSGLHALIMPSLDVETLDLCRFRLAAHGIGREAAMNGLKAEIKSAQANQRNRRLLKLNILFAEALHASGQRMLAMRKIEGTLQSAIQDGLVRTFLDEGRPVIGLLREFQIARTESSEMDQYNALSQFTDRILRRAGYSLDLSVIDDDDIDPAAILTGREQQILEFLSLGLSNRAIAKNLFVTETTVRSHLRKINVKLGAGNRTQAVNVARRLGLLK